MSLGLCARVRCMHSVCIMSIVFIPNNNNNVQKVKRPPYMIQQRKRKMAQGLYFTSNIYSTTHASSFLEHSFSSPSFFPPFSIL